MVHSEVKTKKRIYILQSSLLHVYIKHSFPLLNITHQAIFFFTFLIFSILSSSPPPSSAVYTSDGGGVELSGIAATTTLVLEITYLFLFVALLTFHLYFPVIVCASFAVLIVYVNKRHYIKRNIFFLLMRIVSCEASRRTFAGNIFFEKVKAISKYNPSKHSRIVTSRSVIIIIISNLRERIEGGYSTV